MSSPDLDFGNCPGCGYPWPGLVPVGTSPCTVCGRSRLSHEWTMNQARLLAQARQDLAHESGHQAAPTWAGLSDRERERSILEARQYLRAAERAELQVPARDPWPRLAGSATVIVRGLLEARGERVRAVWEADARRWLQEIDRTPPPFERVSQQSTQSTSQHEHGEGKPPTQPT